MKLLHRIRARLHRPETAVADATVVIAIATVVNLLVSTGLWITTMSSVDISRRTFEAANRPYVGIESIHTTLSAEKQSFEIEAVVKNFGTAPAENFTGSWKLFINGVDKTPNNPLNLPFILFPSGTARLHSVLEGPRTYQAIGTGEWQIEIMAWARYTGPSDKNYVYCEKEDYDPHFDRFHKVGSCKLEEQK